MNKSRETHGEHASHDSVHSWPEDYTHENGNYINNCAQCEAAFIGHKRRVICKVCAEENVRVWDAIIKGQRKERIDRTREESS